MKKEKKIEKTKKEPANWWHDIWLLLEKLYKLSPSGKNAEEEKSKIYSRINGLVADLLDNRKENQNLGKGV